MSGRVLVVGSVNVDVVLRVDRLPAPGETALAKGVARGFGGKGANQALAAATAGARVALLGRLGDDAIGATYRERLAGRGVDVRHLLTTAARRTGAAYVSVDDSGENAIVVDPGANAAVGLADLGPVADLGPGDVLLVQCELPQPVVVEAIRLAHRAGARVVLNLAPSVPLPADVIAIADPLVVNEEEARRSVLAQPAGAATNAGGDPAPMPASLVVTLGGRGATWGELQRPAVRVPAEQVLDTTGAGDAFCGALAAALANGLDRPTALDLALAAGAELVRQVGAQPSL